MPLKQAQASSKRDVLTEITKEYKGGSSVAQANTWKESNFTFSAPSEAWLRGLKPLAAVKVQLKHAAFLPLKYKPV